jgi:hypothetical protein
MEPTATLRSASGKLLDRQALHFEWRARKGEPSDKPPGETTNSETASVGTAAATPTVSSSPPQPALALPPPASPPDTVGRALGREAVASKRGTRLKGPHGKRSSALVHPDPNPTVSIFNPFPWEYLMGTRPTQVQTQPSGKSPARRTEERRPARLAQ